MKKCVYDVNDDSSHSPMWRLLRKLRSLHCGARSGVIVLELLFFIVLSFIIALSRHPESDPNRPTPKPYPPFIGPAYPEDVKPTVRQKQWALTTSCVLTEINRNSQFLLAECTEKNGHGAGLLRNSWGVKNRDDLLGMLQHLEQGGHRKRYDSYVDTLIQRGQIIPRPELSYTPDLMALDDPGERTVAVVKIIHKRFAKKGLAGWDFSRYVSLCRWGVHAGYITEEEAWKKIMPVARMLQSTFTSWEELAYNYQLGRIFWSPMLDDPDIVKVVHRLNNSFYSPWAGLPWSTNLLPEKQQDDGQEEYVIGRCWEDVFGNARDDKTWREHRQESFKWFQKSAEKGNVSGMYFLAYCYRYGFGCQADPQQYRQWMEKCVAAGDPWAHYQWGLSCYRQKQVGVDQKQIAALFSFAAKNQGSAPSLTMQGWMYETGYGGTPKDLKKALEYYEQAALTEEAWAMANIGDAYSRGVGVKKNPVEAARWLHRGAANGNPQSMFHYAECLRKGDGLPTNTVEALAWYHRAATNREERAINYLKRSSASLGPRK